MEEVGQYLEAERLQQGEGTLGEMGSGGKSERTGLRAWPWIGGDPYP